MSGTWIQEEVKMTIINYIVIIVVTILFVFVALPPVFGLLVDAWEKWEDIFTK